MENTAHRLFFDLLDIAAVDAFALDLLGDPAGHAVKNVLAFFGVARVRQKSGNQCRPRCRQRPARGPDMHTLKYVHAARSSHATESSDTCFKGKATSMRRFGVGRSGHGCGASGLFGLWFYENAVGVLNQPARQSHDAFKVKQLAVFRLEKSRKGLQVFHIRCALDKP